MSMTKKQLEAKIVELKEQIALTTEVNMNLQWEIAGLQNELKKVKQK